MNTLKNAIEIHALKIANMSQSELQISLTHNANCPCSTCKRFNVFLTNKSIIEAFTTTESFISTMEKSTTSKQVNKSITVSQCQNPKYNHHNPTPEQHLWIYNVESTINTTDAYLGQILTKEEVNEFINNGTTINIKPRK